MNPNSLLLKAPHLSKEYHPNNIKNIKDVTAGTNKKFLWKCKKGHEWEASPYNRIRNKSGCPYCSGFKATKENNLQTANPILASQWSKLNGDLKPFNMTPSSSKSVFWECEKGHVWKATIRDRNHGNNCPYCSNKKTCKDNSIATTHPEIAAQWHPKLNNDLTPNDVTAASGKKVHWICEKGHVWKALIYTRKYGTNCPECSKYKKTSFPEQTILYYLNKVVKCEGGKKINGKEVDIYIPKYNVGIEYDGVFYHKNRTLKDKQKSISLSKEGVHIIRIREKGLKAIKGISCIMRESNNPGNDSELCDIVKEILNIINLKFNKSLKLKMNISDDRQNILSAIINRNLKESLLSVNPLLSKQWHPTKNGLLKPEHIAPFSGKKYWWKCKQGHEWQATAHKRSNGRGCPFCAGKKIAPDNNLGYLYPKLVKEWNNKRNIFTVAPNSNTKFSWKCKHGHVWITTPNHRVQKNCGCPVCKK